MEDTGFHAGFRSLATLARTKSPEESAQVPRRVRVFSSVLKEASGVRPSGAAIASPPNHEKAYGPPSAKLVHAVERALGARGGGRLILVARAKPLKATW